MLSQVTGTQEMVPGDSPVPPPTRLDSGAGDVAGPVVISHVVDYQHRYPGEVVTFCTMVDVRESCSDLSLRTAIPAGLVLSDCRAPHDLSEVFPLVEADEDIHYVAWSLQGQVDAGTCYEFRAEARVAPATRNQIYTSRAVLTDSAHEILAEETATIEVWAKGKYLRHLPELYEEDEFMGRFLMLFESFAKPIHTQIRNISYYFDPGLSPARWLPWLASWFGLELDERFPEDRQRQLIRSAVWLYRRRGTKQALKEYLELYTNGQVQVIEHRAHDLRLGANTQLGPGVALGRGNRPHTFSVLVRLPSTSATTSAEAQGARPEKEQRRVIEAIIEDFKPAHTTYNLEIELLPEGGRG